MIYFYVLVLKSKMKKLLILPRDRYKSPTSKYRSSRHIKGSTRLIPMNQYGTDSIQNNTNSSNNDLKVSLHREDVHNSSFDSSLQKMPPLIIPPKEKNAELSGKRLEFHKINVKNICACELEGILNYAFECISQMKSVNISLNEIFQEGNESVDIENIFNQNKLKFRKGEFTPKTIDSIYRPLNGEKQTILSTYHTIDSQNYLNFTPELIYKSLSNIFNVEITENHIDDPNPVLNTMINEYQNQMIPFLSPYCPYKQISFPFIVGVGGPPSSGKTTVCQFLQKAFTVNIIHINYVAVEKNKPDKKPPTSLKKTNDKPVKRATIDPPPDSMMITELVLQQNETEDENEDENEDEEESIETEKPPPYYPLSNAYEVDYSDDKSAVNSIVSLIEKIMSENKNDVGFVIDGFPNNKNQYSLLEKTLTSKNVNMHENQIKNMIVPPSQRAKAQMTSIDGVIITTCSPNSSNEKSASSTIGSNFLLPKKRLVDPETGNIYSPNFHMPGLSDLSGISPPFFSEKRDEIEKRLVEVPLDEPINQKAMQKFTQFESTLRKSNKSLLIENCDDSYQLLELLDGFVQKLYKNVQNLIPSIHKINKKEKHANYNQEIKRIKPMITLLSPTSLIKPELTFTAISAWSQCMEIFGKQISDQSQLVTSISEKVETLQKVATERFQLLISKRDERIEICSKFINDIKKKLNVNNIFGLNQNENDASDKSISSPINKALKTKTNPRFKAFKKLNESEVLDESSSTNNLKNNLIDMKDLNDLISNHFRQIWDSSISVRSKNLELIDDLVNKCGLIELILEFRKSPKKYFIFLVHRMIYVKWFYDTFSYIYNFESNEQQSFPFFDDLKLRIIDIPQIDYQLSKPPSDIKKFKSMFSIDANDIKNSKISINKSYMLNDQSINNDITNKQPETARPDYQRKDMNEKQCLAKLQGFKYLEESLNLHTKSDDIFFNSAAACDALGILAFIPSKECFFETDTLKYAEEFFNHVFVSFDGQSDELLETKFDLNSLLANEAKIGLQFFKKFATACRRKEASMVTSVLDLKDSLTVYANSKTTREMENFSKHFRALKSFINGLALRINAQNENINEQINEPNQTQSQTNKRFKYISPYDIRKQKEKTKRLNMMMVTKSTSNKNDDVDSRLFNEDEFSYFIHLSSSDLFEYDVDLISENVRFLADLSLSLDPPLIMQSLLSFNEIVDVAEEASSRGQLFTNIDDFLSNARNTKMNDFSLMKLELCARITECVESFDVKPFLLLFARNDEDEEELIEIFNKPPKPVKNVITSSLSNFMKGMSETAALLSSTIYKNDDNDDVNEEEEEEESADDDTENNDVDNQNE